MQSQIAEQTLEGYPATSRNAAKADGILARADRRGEAPVATFEHVTMDKMDKIAALVAAIMTIGPLFAAFVGRMHS